MEKLFQMFSETWNRARSTQPSAMEKGGGAGEGRREKGEDYEGGGGSAVDVIL